MKLVPVLERNDILRDTSNQALLATDKTALNEHKEKRRLMSSIYRHEKEIESLKEELKLLKDKFEAFLLSKV